MTVLFILNFFSFGTLAAYASKFFYSQRVTWLNRVLKEQYSAIILFRIIWLIFCHLSRLSCNQYLPFYGPFSRKSMHVESLLNLLLNEVLFILNIVYEIYYKHLHEDLLLFHSRNNNFHQLHFFLIFQQARVLYLYLKKTGSEIFFNVCITRILLIWTFFVIKNALYRGGRAGRGGFF